MTFAAIVALTVSLGIVPPAHGAGPDSLQTVRSLDRLARLSPVQLDEVLWLARCIYSESDRTHEQHLVAWVVRNRVETGYRGNTYRSVVLEDKQFSAFNEPSPRRARIFAFNEHSRSPSWRRALDAALDVYLAPSSQNPFSPTTRHFYSPVSMENGDVPHWARGATPLNSARMGVDPNRFLFFDNVDADFTPSDSPAIAAPVPSSDAPKTRRPRRRLRSSGRVARPSRPTIRRPRRRNQ